MGPGHVLPRLPGKGRARGKAERAAPAKGEAGLVIDRMGALAVGVLIGLGTVLIDRRRDPASGQAPADLRGRARHTGGGWLGVARRTWAEFTEDRIPAVAAGSTFYALLALFPALGVFVSLYGLLADVGEAQRQIAGLRGLLPEGGITVLSEQVNRLAAQPHEKLSFTFVVSLLLSIGSSNAGTKGLIAGLNIAYEQREQRNFIMLNLVSLGFTIGATVFAVAGVATIVAVPELLARIGLGDLSGGSVLRWPLMLVVMAGVLSLLYRFAPSHKHPRWRWVTPGGVLAAVLWAAVSAAFSLYVSRFGHYDRTYGSLGALAGFMTWIWLSLTVVLLGAELNCELERKWPKDAPGPG